MNEILRDRLCGSSTRFPTTRRIRCLDYVEFLESKYAERPAGAPPFQRCGGDTSRTRCGPVAFPINIIRGRWTPWGRREESYSRKWRRRGRRQWRKR